MTDEDDIKKYLQRLWDDGQDSDFTITCRGEEWKVHKAVIRRNKFFDGALKHNFKDSFTDKIDMPDDDPSALKSLLQHLYGYNYGEGPHSKRFPWFHDHARVVLLARKYHATIFEREAFLAAKAEIQRDAADQNLTDDDLEMIETIYEVTDEGDEMRAMVVEAFSEHKTDIMLGKADELRELAKNCPQLLLELFRYELKQVNGDRE